MKKKLSILIALVMAISLCLSPVVVSADESPYDTILRLTSKDAMWRQTRDMAGQLQFNSSGCKFEYRFRARGLEDNTSYSLIYYADKPDRYVNWGGDNPGAVIAEFTSDDKGRIKWTAGSVDLGMSLPCSPDANYPGGAKIWLVPTDLLTDGELPMSGWNRPRILFEYNLITYEHIEEAQERNSLTVVMPFGRDSTSYISDSNVLRDNIEVVGIYDDVGYKLVIPEGCVVERPSGERIYSLYLKDINGSELTFTTNDVNFSEPCVLYTTEGELTLNMWGRVVSDGEWVEVGSFTEIVDREATLD